ncbi:hypothetical protein BGW80DRAFT_1256921 [Lactifluus volemus]|nr:hypothetical protein BGW80DRAFT_1256921 [Lactifluus volemus]
MRSLFLHVSALNDEEYTLFTSSFTDLIASDLPLSTDHDYEKQTVSVREARAWLRGRYSDLPVTDLDAILRLFSPSPGQDPVLSRGQFFALLRLVLHVRGGAELDRNLVFKQVRLNTSYNEPASPTRPVNDHPSNPFPAPPRRRQFSAGGVFDVPTSDTNPFTPTAHVHEHSQPPIHPDLRSATISSSPTIVPERPQCFIQATPQLLAAKVPHLTTALMQQSLQASKAGQEAKRIEAQREQERVLQVLKSSTQNGSPSKRSGVGAGNLRPSVDGAGPTIPVLPPRPRVSPTASVTSTRSFEQVAGASLTSHRMFQRSRSPSQPRSLPLSRSRSPPSPSRPTTDLPPPVHPNRQSTQSEHNTDSTALSSPSSARLARSKSVNHSSPPPIPRRRRPESVQVLPPPGASSSTQTPVSLHATPATSASTSFARLPRHLSLSTREPLWDDMRDTLSAVRYKAEAGFSRRGWVPALDKDERLIAERRESGGVPSASSSEDGLGVDAEPPGRRGSLERDEMKWPASDGWRPLA